MKTWASIISDLQQAGMTYAEIGSEIGVAGSTIGDLASGRSKSPRGDAAIRLMGLHSLKAGSAPARPAAAPSVETVKTRSAEVHPPARRRPAAEGATAENSETDGLSVSDLSEAA